MKIVSTSVARQQLSELVNRVMYKNHPVVIGRHNKPQALLIKFPYDANANLSDISNLNQYGGAFDWLGDEPDLYSANDLIKSNL